MISVCIKLNDKSIKCILYKQTDTDIQIKWCNKQNGINLNVQINKS